MNATLRDRVLSRLIIDSSGCLLWSGGLTKNGYAAISQRSGSDRQDFYIHRLMYEWLVGPIPEGLEIDHLCRVRHCASPAHLEAVTRRENTLRGVSPAARQARQTHCIHGHPFDDANTYRWRTRRYCRACAVARRSA